MTGRYELNKDELFTDEGELTFSVGDRARIRELFLNKGVRKTSTYMNKDQLGNYLGNEEAVEYARNVSLLARECVAFDSFQRELKEESRFDSRKLQVYSGMKAVRESAIAYTLLTAINESHPPVAVTISTNKYGCQQTGNVEIIRVTKDLNEVMKRVNKRLLGKKWRKRDHFQIVALWENVLTNIHCHGFLHIPHNYKYNHIGEVLKRFTEVFNNIWQMHFGYPRGAVYLAVAQDPEGFAYYCTKSANDFKLYDEDGRIDYLDKYLYLSGLECDDIYGDGYDILRSNPRSKAQWR